MNKIILISILIFFLVMDLKVYVCRNIKENKTTLKDFASVALMLVAICLASMN